MLGRREGKEIGEAAGTPSVCDQELVCVKFSESPVEKHVDQHKSDKILLIGKTKSA